MIHSATCASSSQLGYGTQCLTVFVEDMDAHYWHAKSAGAAIVEDPNETLYGDCQYGATDLDGHLWLFARHIRPADWGAKLAKR